MLINFTFGNFRSFRDEKTLSMEATSNSEHKESLINVGNYNLLPIAVMYGANSSGKSNVIKAFIFFKYMILESIKNDRDSKLDFDSFKLDETSKESPMTFEIQFIIDTKTYRYGFESNENEIIAEWLFEKGNKKENILFDVEKGEIDIDEKKFSEARGFENIFLGNKLFLPLVAQQSKKPNISKKIMQWFEFSLNTISGINSRGYEGFTLDMLGKRQKGYNNAIGFFKKLDLGFSDYKIEEHKAAEIKKEIAQKGNKKIEEELSQIPDDAVMVNTFTQHTVRLKNGEKTTVFFNEDDMESEGTKKIISLSGPIFDTLKEGSVIIIDELDAKLHPFLTREIIKLFTNKDNNPNGAQLIFATHDTNLLDLSILRRDEIWFTEKDENESSDLYSLAEFKQADGSKIRKDASLEKNYINGRYGAIPYIN